MAPEPPVARTASDEPPLPPVVVPARALIPDAPKGESQYTGEDQAPAGLPEVLPLYAQAIPISSMASPERGTIVNLRSADPAEQIFGWYAGRDAEARLDVEKQSGAGVQHLVTALKGARKATVLITTGPNGSQILLTVLEEH